MCNETDQINFSLSLDNYIASHLESLAGHKSVFDMDGPRQISSNLNMPKTVISTMSRWMIGDTVKDPAKEAKMKTLLT